MAGFNPQIQDTGIPDMTGNSRGPGVNRTFETLFSGLTETAENFVKIKDTATQLDIQDNASKMFDQVNQEFGLDAPSGVTDGLDQIQVLQNAFDQGKLSEVNYYGRLATLAKQLRSRYPGYENIVDATIQSVTGTRPANAYRDALLSQIASVQQEASDQAKFERQYIKENEGIIATLYPDYLENPGKYSFDSVRVGVSRHKGKEETINSRLKEIQLLSSENTFNETLTKKTIDQDFAFITQTFLTQATNANDPTFEQKLNEFTARGGGSPQEINQFITMISEAETTLRTRLHQRGLKEYVAYGVLSREDMNKAIDNAMYPLTQAKEAILGGDFALAGKYATLNKIIEDKAVNDLFNDPDLKIGAGMNKISQDLGREWFIQQRDEIFGRVQDQKSKAIADEITGRTMSGDESILSRTVDEGDSGLTKAALNGHFNALLNPNAGPDNVSSIVKSLFGPNAKNWMDRRVVDPADMETLYTKFLDPRVTQVIYSKGSAEDRRMYYNWAITKARSIPAFAAAAGEVNTLNNLLSSRKTGKSIKVVFDPQTMRIGLQTPLGTDTMAEASAWKPFSRTINAMNKVFTVLGPIIEAQGQDKEAAAKEFVRSLSINIEGVNPGVKVDGEQKQGFFSWLYEGLTMSLEDSVNEGKKMQNTEGNIPETDQDGGEIDFFEEEDYDESNLVTPENMELMQSNFLPNDNSGSQARQFRALDGETGSANQTLPDRPSGRSMGALISSNKRGYNPDLGNLKPDLRKSVESLQEAWGRPLPIVSGYRSPARNAKAGGAKKSQHMHGNAVDIDVSDLSRAERIELIKLSRKMGFGGVGVYANSLHFDKGSRRAWGPSYRNKSLPDWARPYV